MPLIFLHSIGKDFSIGKTLMPLFFLLISAFLQANSDMSTGLINSNEMAFKMSQNRKIFTIFENEYVDESISSSLFQYSLGFKKSQLNLSMSNFSTNQNTSLTKYMGSYQRKLFKKYYTVYGLLGLGMVPTNTITKDAYNIYKGILGIKKNFGQKFAFFSSGLQKQGEGPIQLINDIIFQIRFANLQIHFGTQYLQSLQNQDAESSDLYTTIRSSYIDFYTHFLLNVGASRFSLITGKDIETKNGGRGSYISLSYTYILKEAEKEVTYIEKSELPPVGAKILKISPRMAFITIDLGITNDLYEGMEIKIMREGENGLRYIAKGEVNSMTAEESIVMIHEKDKDIILSKNDFVALEPMGY